MIPNNVNDDLVNEKIRFKEVLVIDSDGSQLGIKMRREALEIAYNQNLDLLCVAPNAKPPVCKVLDYGRHRFEQQKKAKEAKKKQHVTEIKPLRLSPVIDKHDFDTKMRHARKWIADDCAAGDFFNDARLDQKILPIVFLRKQIIGF